MRRILFTLTLAGCNDFLAPLPSPSRVDSLRVLALTTPTPEVYPGTPLSVRAFWVDPSATPEFPPLYFRWRLCRATEGSDPRECPSPSAGIDLHTDGIGDIVQIAPEHLTPSATDNRTVFNVYVALCRGTAPRLDPRHGRFVCDTNAFVEATRRVSVRSSGALNQVPRVAGWALRCGDATVALPGVPHTEPVELRLRPADCARWTLAVTPASGAAERADDGTSETLMASFFTSGGRLDRPRDIAAAGEVRTLQALWTPPALTDGGTTQNPWIWVVLRDQRGGETVLEARLMLR